MRGVLVALTLLVGPAVGFAQEVPAPEPEPAPEPATCTPPCRAGYLCHEGQCISACNPACEPNEICTGDAQCVSRCNPACAANQACTADGACISRCNPPCGAGQTCGADGECRGGATAPVSGPTDPGWARKAYIIGLVTTIIGSALGVSIVIVDDSAYGLAAGIPLTLAFGILTPVVASGASSARKSGNVIGNPGLRLYGWIVYGVTLAGATVAIGLNIAEVETPNMAGPLTLLGISSTMAMAVDARSSAFQAESQGVNPGIGAVRDAGGKLTPTVGLQVAW